MGQKSHSKPRRPRNSKDQKGLCPSKGLKEDQQKDQQQGPGGKKDQQKDLCLYRIGLPIQRVKEDQDQDQHKDQKQDQDQDQDQEKAKKMKGEWTARQ